MNPEDLDLPQPPEGVLHPTMPWSRINPNSRLWLILKSKLTGRRQGDESYTSHVNLSDADADRLIENIKKDPRGYPSLDQESGTPVEWMERQRIYQEWLVEEYLEKPFRKKVDQKIEEAEIERVVNKRRSENIQPQEPLVKPMEPIPDPWEGSYVNSSEIKTPESIIEPEPEPAVETPPSETEPKVPTTDETPKKPAIPDLIPSKIPNRLSQNISEFSNALDNIASELSAHNVLIRRRTSVLRNSNTNLDLVKFLLGQQIENYSEFLNDIETRSREDEIENKDDTVTPTVVKQPEQETSSLPVQTAENKPQKQWWEFWKPDSNKSPTKASAGLMSTSMPAMSRGGISLGTGDKNILKPGIYDNPTVGNLAPGTAIIPLNRNYGKDMFGNYDEIEYLNALGNTMMLPMKGLLGSVLSVYGDILSSLGPLAGFFNSSLPGVLQGASNILGMPVNLVLDMLGGPAYAGVTPNNREMNSFYKSWKAYMDKNNLNFPGGSRPGSGGGGSGAGEGQDSGGAEVEWAGGLEYPPPRNPFEDTDGQETGIDISLRGKGSNGYGRGLTIRNPWDNLYYFSKVPQGFQNPGGPTRGVQGTSQRVAKGTGPSGFGHWATYYIKDSDGTFYELMIGHLDRAAPTWNDTGNGVKLNKGVKIGIQGASGSSVGNTPDGTYDHMTTHINSPNRKNPSRSGQLLIQWARDLDAYKPPQMPPQPQVAQNKFESGGVVELAKGGGWQLPSLPTLLPSPIDLVQRLIGAKPKPKPKPKKQSFYGPGGDPSGSGKGQFQFNKQKSSSGYVQKSSSSLLGKPKEPQVPKLDPDLTPMQNWAKLFPELAKKVKPGQSGYEEIQKVLSPQTSSMPQATPTTTAVATESKSPPKQTTMQMPSAPSAPSVTPSSSASSVSFVRLDMDTNKVKELTKLRRIQ